MPSAVFGASKLPDLTGIRSQSNHIRGTSGNRWRDKWNRRSTYSTILSNKIGLLTRIDDAIANRPPGTQHRNEGG